METVKAGKPLIEFVELCYRAKRAPLLVGQHGVGKSELLEQAAKRLGITYIHRDLSLMEPPDLVGLPVTKDGTTTYLPPSFLPREGKGLLAIEELNRCEKYMQAPCLQLLTTRTLNDYQLPQGWLMVASINPDDEEYNVSRMDPALLSRFVKVEVIPDVKEWLNWARENGVHDQVIRYVETDESVFDDPDSNPRAWKYVSELLKSAGDDLASCSALRAAVLGTVGDERGAAFLRTLKQTERPLTARDILDNYYHHRESFKRWIEMGRIDLVDSSLRAVLKYLQPEAEYELVDQDGQSWAQLSAFIGDLPGDQRATAQEFFHDRGYRFPIKRRRRVTQ